MLLAPDAQQAARRSKHFISSVLRIEAVANNAYQGELFPRFIDWEQPFTIEAPC